MLDSNGTLPVFLGNTGTTSTGPGQRLASRDRRHVLKHAQRALTEGRASKLCYLAAGSRVTVSVGPLLIAHVSGVHRCGSVWNCPLCAPVVLQGRALDIDQGASVVLSEGGSALFVTATGPHRMGDPLGPLFDLACRFGELTMRGAKAKGLRQSLGLVGTIRAVQITYGANGWHPHVHSLFLFDSQLTPTQVADFRTFLFDRWERALARKGFAALHPVHGLDVRPVFDSAGLSEYVTKVEGGWGVGLELARSDLKDRSVAPMELLSRWALGGDLEARDLWQEYEAVTFGRRCIQWSPGLRSRLLPDVDELTDVDLASAEGEDVQLLTFEFEGWEWDEWVRVGDVALVLRQVEEAAALVLFLASFGASSTEVRV